MPYLEKSLRRQLSSTIDKARLVAEEGAADAIRRLGVAEDAAPAWLSEPDRLLRRTLRAHARSLGDVQVGSTLQGTTHLMETAAFEHWHRMLFGRFLVERGLLVHPAMGVVIERGELAELAAEEGLPDEWALVERIAAPALPAVFKPDDPALKLPLAPEYAKRLRDLVAGLPEAVFAADDSLGWTYQFWRAAEKDRVNKAGGKIGAAELPVVTQLFTEPYMVRFLLHNTLGAWHAGRVLAADPTLAREAADELALRAACALPGYEWEFLRFVREGDVWRPAAGTFPGWPEAAARVTVLDPCCGSGHFLTEALAALAALRGAEESLTPAGAVAAVLRDNLHGLEIDGRCVQIAAFALALAAWRIGGAATPLPVPHIAWVGAPPPLPKAEFCALSNGDAELSRGLAALHDLFVQAPLLGSLLNIKGGNLVDPARVARIERSVASLVERLRGAEPERAESALAARGMADAASILGSQFTLQATNVPFLARNKMAANLSAYASAHLAVGSADLSTALIQRMLQNAPENGTIAVVSPQNWYQLISYCDLRRDILSTYRLNTFADLGPAAFHDMNWWAARTALTAMSKTIAVSSDVISVYDAQAGRDPETKERALLSRSCNLIPQSSMYHNPDHRISTILIQRGKYLKEYASSWEGMTTGDLNSAVRMFWELTNRSRWRFLNGSVRETTPYSGREQIVLWGDDGEALLTNPSAVVKGREAFGKRGIRISQMRHLPVTLYEGECVDKNGATLIPHDIRHLPAIWEFCSSPDFQTAVRELDSKVNVTIATFTKVRFDLDYWQAAAAERYPDGLPEPYSDDPTQWLFHGHPAHAEPGTELHVALARLAGYRWPAEIDPSIRLAPLARERVAMAGSLPPADETGLLPLHAYGDRRPLADRLRTLLTAAYIAPVSPEREFALVRAADIKSDGKAMQDCSLESWLANRAFRQHCKLFHDRPFLWHLWDGLHGGFSAYLYYHRLDAAALQTFTYTVLGDWITLQAASGDTSRQEAARRLQQNLISIAQGEAPLDIFVRWKSLAQQPMGWNPDLDDGVRLNIRPFMTAGVLREQPRGISWGKDRGTDVASAPWFGLGPQYGEKPGSRINDHHLTLAEKQAARTQAAAE